MFKKTAAIAAITSVAFGAASAEDGTESITLVGEVKEECSVDAFSSNVNVFDGLDQTAAVVDIQCNLAGELNVSVTTTDGVQELVHSGGGDSIPYKWRFKPGQEFVENVNQTDSYTNTPLLLSVPEGFFLTERRYTIEIDLDDPDNEGGGTVAPEDFFAGEYSDVMTISIAPAAGA